MLDALRNISYYYRGTTLKGETAHYRDQAELFAKGLHRQQRMNRKDILKNQQSRLMLIP